MLSLWWSEGARDDLCWRSSNSGGRATSRNKQGKSTAASYGDICPIDDSMIPFWKVFTTELKSGYTDDLNLFDILDKPSGLSLFDKFWKKLELDCEAAKKAGWGGEPLLIFKRNRREILVALWNGWLFSSLTNHYGMPTFTTIRGGNRIICTFKDFLNWISPEYFRRK